MILPFKKMIGILFLFITFIQTSAQEFKGIAIYKTSSKMTMTMDSTKMSRNDQKELNAMIRKSMQKEYELRFDKNESLYKEIESLKNDGDSQGIEVIGLGAGTEGGIYKNSKTKSIVETRDLFGKLFLVKDSLVNYKWKLEDETRKIGNYICHKAISVKKQIKKITVLDESGKEKVEEKEFITTLTAWYTPQIPVSTGPASYWGLPGLIMEMDNGRLSMICSKIILNPQKEVVIKEPSKGKVVSSEEYDTRFMEKVNEMKEMYSDKRKKKKN